MSTAVHRRTSAARPAGPAVGPVQLDLLSGFRVVHRDTPNRAFLSDISGVLPSLDASDVLQVDLASLYTGEAAAAATDRRPRSHAAPRAARAEYSRAARPR